MNLFSIATFDQNLSVDGRPVTDNDATLGQLRFYPGCIVTVKVSSLFSAGWYQKAPHDLLRIIWEFLLELKLGALTTKPMAFTLFHSLVPHLEQAAPRHRATLFSFKNKLETFLFSRYFSWETLHSPLIGLYSACMFVCVCVWCVVSVCVMCGECVCDECVYVWWVCVCVMSVCECVCVSVCACVFYMVSYIWIHVNNNNSYIALYPGAVCWCVHDMLSVSQIDNTTSLFSCIL